MKLYKLALRIWIGIASILGFLGGWTLLAHSGKPVLLFSSSPAATVNQPVIGTGSISSTNISVVPTLPPLPTLQNNTNTTFTNNAQPVQIQVPAFQISSLPQITTRGS